MKLRWRGNSFWVKYHYYVEVKHTKNLNRQTNLALNTKRQDTHVLLVFRSKFVGRRRRSGERHVSCSSFHLLWLSFPLLYQLDLYDHICHFKGRQPRSRGLKPALPLERPWNICSETVQVGAEPISPLANRAWIMQEVSCFHNTKRVSVTKDPRPWPT